MHSTEITNHKEDTNTKSGSESPTGHMQVFDTYFYNTIPRKPLSFTIHPEWVSEVLHAKRIALQKKEGMKYKHTNYSFAY